MLRSCGSPRSMDQSAGEADRAWDADARAITWLNGSAAFRVPLLERDVADAVVVALSERCCCFLQVCQSHFSQWCHIVALPQLAGEG